MPPRHISALCLSLFFPLSLLSGCAFGPAATPTPDQGLAMAGSVFGGQSPIAGSHVYLMAANTAGYGSSSISLLESASTGNSDSVGAYVATDANGGFNITGDYTCTPNQQVYLLALGGNPGAGVNSSVGLMAVLGNCPAIGNFLATTPFIQVNEVSTIAAAFAIAGFATDSTRVSSSNTTQGLIGLTNAFANASNLEDLASGTARTKTIAGNGTIPQTRINTMGNILAACVNSTGAVTGPTTPSACYTLFNNTKNASGTVPSETATAAINLAHYPGTAATSGVTALYNLGASNPPFSPTLTSAPKDFVIGIKFTGNSTIGAYSVAIDASGNAWLANTTNLSELSPLGVVISGTNGFGSSTLQDVESIAIDPVNGNIWTGDEGLGGLEQFSNTGVMNPLSPFTGPSGTTGPGDYLALAVDLNSNLWVGNDITGTMDVFSSSGTLATGFPVTPAGGGPSAMTPLANGNVWSVGLNYVNLLAPSGADITPAAVASNSDASAPGIALVDLSGNLWVTQQGYLVELSPTGDELSPIGTGYPGGGNDTSTTANEAAIDGAGVIFLANNAKNTLTAFSTVTKKAISTSSGFSGGTVSEPECVAIDPSGNVWVATQTAINGYPFFTEGITELIGIAAPTVTPITPGLNGVRP